MSAAIQIDFDNSLNAAMSARRLWRRADSLLLAIIAAKDCPQTVAAGECLETARKLVSNSARQLADCRDDSGQALIIAAARFLQSPPATGETRETSAIVAAVRRAL